MNVWDTFRIGKTMTCDLQKKPAVLQDILRNRTRGLTGLRVFRSSLIFALKSYLLNTTIKVNSNKNYFSVSKTYSTYNPTNNLP